MPVGMTSAGIRIIAMAVLVVLACGARCLAICAVAPCETPSQPAPCHESKQSRPLCSHPTFIKPAPVELIPDLSEAITPVLPPVMETVWLSAPAPVAVSPPDLPRLDRVLRI